MDKIKVIEVTSSLNIGGAETLLMNLLEHIDNKKLSIDFLCYGDEKFDYEPRVKQFGSNIYRIGVPAKIGLVRHIIELYKFFKKNKYDVVHCHNLFNCGPVVLGAYLARVKIRISHSHTTQYLDQVTLKKRVYFVISRFLINCFSTKKFACSEKAGQYLFGKNSNFIIIKNGINTSDFIFSSELRDFIRNNNRIPNNTTVLGHVGRFVSVKNHEFLIELFKDYVKQNPNSLLVLIGDGELKGKIVSKVKKYNLEKKVLFTGKIENVNEYYNIMDCFLFPSFIEGLPLTLVEAQTNGLPIIASSNINKDSNITGEIIFCDLKKEKWLELLNKQVKKKRYNKYDKIIESGFDIIDASKTIQKEYLS